MKYTYKLTGTKDNKPLELDVVADGGKYDDQAHSIWYLTSYVGEGKEFDVIDNIEFTGKY